MLQYTPLTSDVPLLNSRQLQYARDAMQHDGRLHQVAASFGVRTEEDAFRALAKTVPNITPIKRAIMVETTAEAYLRNLIDTNLQKHGIVILPPNDVNVTLSLVQRLSISADVSILDPWYNKGFGGVQDDYMPFFLNVIKQCELISQHIFFWGFPEIVAPFVERIPAPLELVCWLTWYYKNNPSVIRGWRSSQNACLHLSKPKAKLFPERFLNHKQKKLAEQGKLRYMPGPTSVLDDDFPSDVIEQSLLVGFVGKKERTGHPSQKPFKVYERILLMTVPENGTVFDPMCGSGTTGAVAKEHHFAAILCDKSEEYTQMVEDRLELKRIDAQDAIACLLKEECK